MNDLIVLGLFDNPVFSTPFLFLLGVIIAAGLIGLLGRSESIGLFGSFLVFEHIVTAVGSNIQPLNVANFVVLGILLLYMLWTTIGRIALGGTTA